MNSPHPALISLLYQALTDEFAQSRRVTVYCAVRAECLNIAQVNPRLEQG